MTSTNTMSGAISSIRATSPSRPLTMKISLSGNCAKPSSIIDALAWLMSMMAIRIRAYCSAQ